jgi:hypothetical protein
MALRVDREKLASAAADIDRPVNDQRRRCEPAIAFEAPKNISGVDIDGAQGPGPQIEAVVFEESRRYVGGMS